MYFNRLKKYSVEIENTCLDPKFTIELQQLAALSGMMLERIIPKAVLTWWYFEYQLQPSLGFVCDIVSFGGDTNLLIFLVHAALIFLAIARSQISNGLCRNIRLERPYLPSFILKCNTKVWQLPASLRGWKFRKDQNDSYWRIWTNERKNRAIFQCESRAALWSQMWRDTKIFAYQT